MRETVSNLKTLVVMQLRDKIDLSFIRNKKSLLFKSVLYALLFAIITIAFYFVFKLCKKFGIFSFGDVLPDTVITVIFTVIQLMSLVSCIVGLTETLYLSKDNAVLLTLPVGHAGVFLSKLIVYFIFELKRNLTFTVPMYLAYGITGGAVWYFYPWLIVCFFLFSLLPVALASIISIPALFVGNFVRRYRWLQLALTTVVTVLAVWLFFVVIGKIPQNINLIGQWGSISAGIQKFLRSFAGIFAPYHYVNLMVIGGTLKISSALLSGMTMAYFGILTAVLAASLGLAFLLARPLFFRMASRQFEYEKRVVPPRKNKVHGNLSSMFWQDLQRNFRSSKFIVSVVLQVVLPAALVYALNKVYAAMNTSMTGQIMTRAFSTLVILMTALSFNTAYASVYSRDGGARNLEKTRPVKMLTITCSRLVTRAVLLVVSSVFAVILYAAVSGTSAGEAAMLCFIVIFTGLAHLLWSAELDVMNPKTENFQTLGLDYDNPNERKAMLIATVLSAVVAFVLYFLSNESIVKALVKVLIVTAVLLGARAYLFFVRCKLYYAEK
ncbi:MAG: hypothetical protein NC132_04465 [Corallococcus sp.]|nr:hypothetical protein [Corallococcus sp.]MCM1359915.1 hypothetical protein [Corallococcus sp.]MCM1395348.1 hypothetical protein [Corallococcus sp.]